MTRPPAPRIALVPLDKEILERRLATDDFRLQRDTGGTDRMLHFGPDFPGAVLPAYRPFLDAVDAYGVLAGSYVVVDLDTDEAVGQVGTKGPPDGAEVEIGYGMVPAVWGRGVATEAVRIILERLAAPGRVGTVVARSAITNPASGRVLEKAGFRQTGREQSDDEGELLVWAYPYADAASDLRS